jgi:hypothetical protein
MRFSWPDRVCSRGIESLFPYVRGTSIFDRRFDHSRKHVSRAEYVLEGDRFAPSLIALV